jgi:methylaspartate mutase epsilon subunit
VIEAVASLRSDLGRALVDAFRLGYLDVPYCLHPDNANTARSYLDTTGRLRWSRLGAIPISPVVRPASRAELTSAELLAALCYVERKFDNASLEECLAVPV